MAKWIGFVEARELYLDRAEKEGFSSNILRTADKFYYDLLEELSTARLPAKTEQPESFSLSHTKGSDLKTFSLISQNIIPSLFWYHLKEFIEDISRIEFFERTKDTYFEGVGNGFEFKQTMAGSGAVIVGIAHEVKFRRDGIPGLLSLGGRAKGLSKALAGDLPVVEAAKQDIESGRLTYSEAIAAHWSKMPNPKGMTGEASLKKRLRRRLIEAGLTDK